MKSKVFILTATCAAALAVSACQKEPQRADIHYAQKDTAVCVDRQGKRVPDSQCGSPRTQSGFDGGDMATMFLWYYMGRSSVVPYYGDRVSGGSYKPRPGVNYYKAPKATSFTRSAAVSRGGLGSSSRSSVSGSGRSVAS